MVRTRLLEALSQADDEREDKEAASADDGHSGYGSVAEGSCRHVKHYDSQASQSLTRQRWRAAGYYLLHELA